MNRFIRSFEIVENKNESSFNGLFGYTAYDAVKYFEDIETEKGKADSSDIPEMIYIFTGISS